MVPDRAEVGVSAGPGVRRLVSRHRTEAVSIMAVARRSGCASRSWGSGGGAARPMYRQELRWFRPPTTWAAARSFSVLAHLSPRRCLG